MNLWVYVISKFCTVILAWGRAILFIMVKFGHITWSKQVIYNGELTGYPVKVHGVEWASNCKWSQLAVLLKFYFILFFIFYFFVNKYNGLSVLMVSFLFVQTFRYFNVIGSDPEGRLGEAPRPELREHGRISGACFDAASGVIPGLKVCWFVSPRLYLLLAYYKFLMKS